MSKSKSAFLCQSCGYESAKWLGKCPSCNSWNSFAEEVIAKNEGDKNEWRQESVKSKVSRPKTLEEIEPAFEVRIPTPDKELNRVLGGGIVPGSVVLIGGEPGIGKSTLMLQFGLALKNQKVLYISGEESEQQIKMRADRLGLSPETSGRFYTLTETSTRNIFLAIESLGPQLVIVDSIQTLYSHLLDSSAGSIGQVRKYLPDGHQPNEGFKESQQGSCPPSPAQHINDANGINGNITNARQKNKQR